MANLFSKITRIYRVFLFPALIFAGGFLFAPHTQAALTLPTTTCDTIQENPVFHLTSSMTREDGTKAFRYGPNNNSFVSSSGDLVFFDTDVIFTVPTGTTNALIKLLAFDENCFSISGFGPVFRNLIGPGSNVISYNKTTHQTQLGDLINDSFPSGTVRYIWLEVLDNYPGATFESYSYLIDLENLRNPTGTVDGLQRIDPVIIIPGILGSEQKDGEFVIDPILHTYDDLIDTLKANGYVEGYNLFIFPYDWRRSNTESALLLENKIGQVLDICQCTKVDLVAHSMGGLIAREYIQSDRYANNVDQLIFLGTPHLGATKSYLSWEGGVVGPSIEDRRLQFLLSREGKRQGFSSLFDYVRNRPITSLQQLLPVFDYIRNKSDGEFRAYPINYPENIFLENLDANLFRLFNSGIRITNVIGKIENSTINNLRVVDSQNLPLWEHGYPDGFNENFGDRGLELGRGDGTVPEISGRFIEQDINELTVRHIELPTKAEELIFKKLTGQNAAILIDKNRFVNLKLLIIKMLSPADFQVISPDNKKVGKNFETGEEVNEIDGAFYSGFLTDDEFITIPNPLNGEYRVVTQGTDSGGEYTISAGYMSDDTLVERDFTAQTEPGLVAELELNVDSANPESLTVLPEDTIPPEITIHSPQSRDYLRSELVPIDVGILDQDVGVFSSEIRLDDIIIDNGEIVDLFFQNLGTHRVSAEAADFVGNSAQAQAQFRIIATIDSTISDAQRAYSLDWITDPVVKDSLISKLLVAKKKGKLDKTAAKSIMSLLDAQRNKSINERAYQLLKEDVNWLLNN